LVREQQVEGEGLVGMVGLVVVGFVYGTVDPGHHGVAGLCE
jgi:hypothetical protein